VQTITQDVVIIGGGIAGLWLHHSLQKKGYQCLLLEKDLLGGVQSTYSQGIIHGGTKYSLNGALSKATNAIADMPARWQRCIQGTGEVDLSAIRVASDHHYMWSKDRLTSKLTAFFASRALGNKIEGNSTELRPEAFNNEKFHGNFYALKELVLDIPSVVEALAAPYRSSIYQFNCAQPNTFEVANGKVIGLILQHKQKRIRIEPSMVVLTAGEGNESLLHSAGFQVPAMQRRPLHMVLVKHEYPHPVFAHCIGTGSKPLITITTHYDKQGNPVWYLGGNLAETGVELDSEKQIQSAKTLLAEILPWINLGRSVWKSFLINRAEPRQNLLTRPDSAFVHQQENLITAWPTKLALTPNLVDEVCRRLAPPEGSVSNCQLREEALTFLPHPAANHSPWEKYFC
jgi:glycerol-3-phosphate dehydrogenase